MDSRNLNMFWSISYYQIIALPQPGWNRSRTLSSCAGSQWVVIATPESWSSGGLCVLPSHRKESTAEIYTLIPHQSNMEKAWFCSPLTLTTFKWISQVSYVFQPLQTLVTTQFGGILQQRSNWSWETSCSLKFICIHLEENPRNFTLLPLTAGWQNGILYFLQYVIVKPYDWI